MIVIGDDDGYSGHFLSYGAFFRLVFGVGKFVGMAGSCLVSPDIPNRHNHVTPSGFGLIVKKKNYKNLIFKKIEMFSEFFNRIVPNVEPSLKRPVRRKS